MSNDLFIAILLFIGAVLAAVLYVLDRTNRRLADALPPQLLPLIAIALDALATLATQTETPLDDEIIQQLRDALGLSQAQAAALAKVISAQPSNKQIQRVPTVKAQAAPYVPVMHVDETEASG